MYAAQKDHKTQGKQYIIYSVFCTKKIIERIHVKVQDKAFYKGQKEQEGVSDIAHPH